MFQPLVSHNQLLFVFFLLIQCLAQTFVHTAQDACHIVVLLQQFYSLSERLLSLWQLADVRIDDSYLLIGHCTASIVVSRLGIITHRLRLTQSSLHTSQIMITRTHALPALIETAPVFVFAKPFTLLLGLHDQFFITSTVVQYCHLVPSGFTLVFDVALFGLQRYLLIQNHQRAVKVHLCVILVEPFNQLLSLLFQVIISMDIQHWNQRQNNQQDIMFIVIHAAKVAQTERNTKKKYVFLLFPR